MHGCFWKLTLAAMLILTGRASTLESNAIAQQPVREVHPGIDGTAFQKMFDGQIKKRYAPIDFSLHYGLRGRTVMSSIWEKRESGRVKMQVGQTREAMEKLVNTFADEGFRLEHLTSGGVGGPEQYSGIWSKAPGQQLAVRYGYPQKEMLKLHQQLQGKKYAIHRIMAVEEERSVRFTAVWEKDEPGTRELQLGLSETAFLRAVKTRKKQRFRLRQAFGYVDRRYPKIACIWETADGPEQEIRIRLTDASLKKALAEMRKKGFVPAMIHGFAVNGRNRYIAVWEKVKTKD